MAKVRVRKRGKTYSYSFDIQKSPRRMKEKGGFSTKEAAYEAGMTAFVDWKHGNIGITSERVTLAVEDIIDYEEIDEELARTGEFFALQIRGASMKPVLYERDIVIVRKQSSVSTGDIAIVLINGDEATVKKIRRETGGVMLIGYNAAVYEPHFYTNEDIERLPVQILGKVVEMRRKF